MCFSFLVLISTSVEVTDVLLSEVVERLSLSKPGRCTSPVSCETCVQDHWKELSLNSGISW